MFINFPLREPVARALAAKGFTTQTAIQEAALPHALNGGDVLGLARTGTGKTLAFGLPIAHRLTPENARGRAPRALILAPTRELALQVAGELEWLATDLNVVTVYGGTGYGKQAADLKRGADIVVATPGRAIDYYKQGLLQLAHVEVVVLDEADEMLNAGLALQRTPLFDSHLAAGGRIVPFAGWEMPVQYVGVIPEVRAVRQNCGVFDVSHMARFAVRGADVAAVLNTVMSADWSQTPNNSAAYALLLNENGGVLDDIMGYHISEDHWDVVSNASRAAVVEAHLRKHLPASIRLENRTAQTAMLAIQGPRAIEILTKHGNLPHPFPWRRTYPVEIFGVQGQLARGGYTGSDGFEFVFAAQNAVEVWENLLQVGALPCGLGARDVLRLEAGLPLYGHELRENWTPAESGAGWAVKFDKGNFIGREAAQRAPRQKIVALRMNGKAIPREGYSVAQDGQNIGEVTSGSLSPTLGVGIALARATAPLQIGDAVDVIIRGTAHPARVVTKPFVPHVRG